MAGKGSGRTPEENLFLHDIEAVHDLLTMEEKDFMKQYPYLEEHEYMETYLALYPNNIVDTYARHTCEDNQFVIENNANLFYEAVQIHKKDSQGIDTELTFTGMTLMKVISEHVDLFFSQWQKNIYAEILQATLTEQDLKRYAHLIPKIIEVPSDILAEYIEAYIRGEYVQDNELVDDTGIIKPNCNEM